MSRVQAWTDILPSLDSAEGRRRPDFVLSIPPDIVGVAQVRFFGNSSYWYIVSAYNISLLQELLKMKLSSGILQYIGMKKPPVGAGTFCPFHILVFYIPACRKYLPVSGARPSPCCYRKIPEEPQNKKGKIARNFR
jgi:hypothetical protein